MKIIITMLVVFISTFLHSQNCNTQETKSRRTQVCKCEMNTPNSYITQISMTRGKKTFNGTAFFIHPRVLLTAGHNLRKRKNLFSKRVKNITIRVGATNEDKYIHSEKIETTQNENIYTLESFNKKYSIREDYGIIIMPNDSAYQKIKGYFKLNAYNGELLKTKKINIAGYPGDKSFCSQWEDSTIFHYLKNGVLKYDFKTHSGLSGAPIWHDNNNGYEVFAIHTNGVKTDCTTATIITDKIYEDIVEFCKSKGIMKNEKSR